MSTSNPKFVSQNTAAIPILDPTKLDTSEPSASSTTPSIHQSANGSGCGFSHESFHARKQVFPRNLDRHYTLKAPSILPLHSHFPISYFLNYIAMSTTQSKRIDRLVAVPEEEEDSDKSQCNGSTRSCSSSRKSQLSVGPYSPSSNLLCVSLARYLQVRPRNKLTLSDWQQTRPRQTEPVSRPSRYQKRPASSSRTTQNHASNRNTHDQGSTAASGSVTSSAQHTVIGAVWSGLSYVGKAFLPSEQADGDAETVNSQFRNGTEGDRK